VKQYLKRSGPENNSGLVRFLDEIVDTVKVDLPVRVSRKDAVLILEKLVPEEEAVLLFERWERELRGPKIVGDWAVSYSVYSDSLVIEYLPEWGQIERTIDIRSRRLRSELQQALSALSPNDFSYFLANLFSRVDWASDVSITKLSRDGGIDFQGYYVYPDQVKVPLFGQAKHWKEKVGSDPIRTFVGSVMSRARGKATVGVYVCSGGFTPDAVEEIQRAPFRLIRYDNAELIRLMIESRVGVEDFRPQCLRIDGSFWHEISQ
jgi:hypothetical protein